MMTYEQIMEAHREKTAGYIARAFDTSKEHVTFIGLVNIWRPRSICTNQSHRVLEPIDGPMLFVDFPPTVTLDKEFEHVDNVLNRKTTVFAGQCPECGHVYMAEYTLSKV